MSDLIAQLLHQLDESDQHQIACHKIVCAEYFDTAFVYLYCKFFAREVREFR